MTDWLPLALGAIGCVVVVASVAAALAAHDAVREIRKTQDQVTDLTRRWEQEAKR